MDAYIAASGNGKRSIPDVGMYGDLTTASTTGDNCAKLTNNNDRGFPHGDDFGQFNL
ncbi:MAG: hypothetical protein GY754_31435 [bacterium]|nr:hypothetical protein [bacterium]